DWVSSSGVDYRSWYKEDANYVSGNAYQIHSKPNKYLCKDCSGSEAYDPATALTGTYGVFAFVEEVKQHGSSLMAYIARPENRPIIVPISILLLGLGFGLFLKFRVRRTA
ncbi:MAG: hypothetical protein KDK90_27825, partial [Leptospiraceae bacterium]|nr:hypothetical protein [Leptospiraceae bacterium]